MGEIVDRQCLICGGEIILKACAHCGSDAEIVISSLDTNGIKLFIKCRSCPAGIISTFCKDAILAWNRRDGK
ncbi:MAG: Lar family restriction alleviation protein [Treponema sp.]|nr:Lar family restriction alleviation protein [Treponema sp.]